MMRNWTGLEFWRAGMIAAVVLQFAGVSLAQALAAGEHVVRFLAGVTLDDYSHDVVLTSAVERQFEIVGEALARAVAADESLRARIPHVAAVIGFRNRLAHGYDDISDRVVWTVAHAELPPLLDAIRAIIEEIS